MKAPEVLLYEASPNGDMDAIVEHDGRVVYFYLNGGDDSEFGIRSCWVRNLVAAPAELDLKGMQEDGIPPLLPTPYCKHPEGASPLKAEDLEVVWFETGEAAGIYENGELLAVIPSWSGFEGFDGYARDCEGESPVAWGLAGAHETLSAELAAAREYWDLWDLEEGPWEALQSDLLSAYEQLGPLDKYYAIDGGEWPPKALLRIPIDGGVALVTIGLALRVQPATAGAPELADCRRIELGIALSDELPAGAIAKLTTYLSAQTNLPWADHTWLGPGHTVPCDSIPHSPAFCNVALNDELPGSPDIALPTFRGDQVKLLWMTPITEAERRYAMEFDTEELFKQGADEGLQWQYKDRQEFSFVRG